LPQVTADTVNVDTVNADTVNATTINADLVETIDANISNDLFVGGKLTVTGMIDPPGMTMNESIANPGVVASGDGTIWMRNDSPNILNPGASPFFVNNE